MSDIRSTPGASRPSSILMLAVFLTAMAVLGFEVSLTRAFSVLLRFHFVFLAISLATCGLGLGGLIDFLLRRSVLRDTAPVVVLSFWGSLCAALIPLSFVLLFASPLSAKLTSVWIVTAICLPPYLAAGAFLSHAFAGWSGQGGKLYAADLVGAALGSFLVIGALQLLGGINAGMIWGVAVGLGAIALCLSSPKKITALLPSLVTVATLLLVLFNRSGAIIDLPLLPLHDDPNAKPLYQELGDPKVGAKIVDKEWNAFARTDVVSNAGTDDLYVYTDGEVPTNMIPFDGNLTAMMPRLVQFIGFYAFYQTRPEKALLIGPGGGLDVLLALSVGTKQIDGAELNPSIPRLVRKYGDLTGHIYDIEGVNIRVDEGRSFVIRQREQYDLIYMALTKTATTASSSLALLESYIHTIEAFEAFLANLSERGAIAFVCQDPLILMRTMLTATAALEKMGVPREETMNHVAMLSMPRAAMMMGPYRYMLMVTKSPIKPEMAQDWASDCIAMRLEPVFFPQSYEPLPFTKLTKDNLNAKQFVQWWNAWQGLEGSRKLDFTPCPDDRPFVVDMSTGIPRQFMVFLWSAIILVILLSIAIVNWLRKEAGPSLPGINTLAGAALYFSLLGIGFMLVEIVLIQRLVLYLGYPVLTLSVILFSLLLGGGIGSAWSQRWPEGAGLVRRAAIAAALVAIGSVVVFYLHPWVVQASLQWDIRLRCLITMLLVMPMGFLMGIPFPTGVRVVGTWGRDIVPWAWGLNGVTSVVGSVGAMSLAKFTGFGAVLFTGAGIYAIAAILAFIGANIIGQKTTLEKTEQD